MIGARGRTRILARLGAGVVASAAAGFLVRTGFAALVGFLGGVSLVVALERARDWIHSRYAAAILRGESDADLRERLEHGPTVTREAAARRLLALEGPAKLVPVLVERAHHDASSELFPGARALALACAEREEARGLAVAQLAARIASRRSGDELEDRTLAQTLALLRPDEATTAPLLEGEARPRVRLALASAIPATEAGARALVGLAADASLERDVRAAAFESLADAPWSGLAGPVRAALERATPPTVELLWLLGLTGQPSDAALAARTVAAETFDVASASLSAVEELLDRGEPADRAPLDEALRSAREKIRAIHPPGDNRLADELVARIEDLGQPRESA